MSKQTFKMPLLLICLNNNIPDCYLCIYSVQMAIFHVLVASTICLLMHEWYVFIHFRNTITKIVQFDLWIAFKLLIYFNFCVARWDCHLPKLPYWNQQNFVFQKSGCWKSCKWVACSMPTLWKWILKKHCWETWKRALWRKVKIDFYANELLFMQF